MGKVSDEIIATLTRYGELERFQLIDLLRSKCKTPQLINTIWRLKNFGSIESKGYKRGRVIYKATGKPHTKMCLSCLKRCDAWLVNDDGVCGYCRHHNKQATAEHQVEQLNQILPIGYTRQLIHRNQKSKRNTP
ncbi:hypothetical protein AT251_17655 [Enterovibrio nigricans]|uniref:Uncharacterized protein n=1 Tax=Enterovibrio nigricans DSM 22720 TaxID=1121868 RepID=A0A1T4VNA8_9GAMM|nr:hypothetical protein [Enterovibrio nigricans]PKF49619.1 hypothetical protein AT251_17655 [Enterovibrio nigricans]SKA66385.1 hypothetical protein SAMN02745132_04107 [Enterovibrio nigricans DSM 22720]